MADIRVRFAGWLLGLEVSRIVDAEQDEPPLTGTTALITETAPRPDMWREEPPGDFRFRR